MQLLSRINQLEKAAQTYRPVSFSLPPKELFLNDFVYFIQYFYKLIYGREFVISTPRCRESHHLIIINTLLKVFNGDILRLLIHCPPRYGKTELIINFIAWTLAHYPDSNYLYLSYSYTVAEDQTIKIKRILDTPEYKKLFDVYIPKGEKSKAGHFSTNQRGEIIAVGAEGSITSRGAGIAGSDRWSGCIAMDDMHKPEEVHSDTMRQKVIDWYGFTAQSRTNDPTTPIIFIGQRLHELDLPASLRDSKMQPAWERVNIPALDAAGNALNPDKHTVKQLLDLKSEWPYMFASQYQQEPQPAGGAIFKTEWFTVLDEEPELLATFLTCDTAETDKTYNDATVFSFWGVYKKKIGQTEVEIYALHWLDCLEDWIEPFELESRFLSFYEECVRFCNRNKAPLPNRCAIEKKSTGVSLVSTLKTIQGLRIEEIQRAGTGNSKTKRFLDIQGYVSKLLITFPRHAKHIKKCTEHMSKITANDSHRYDDIADTAADAVQLALIDKVILSQIKKDNNNRIIPGYKAFNNHRMV